jgi:uncharacterized membrane protein YphA (DoxX/SURF4 family)
MESKKSFKTIILCTIDDNRAVLVRVIVGLVFLSEGVQKYLFPELVGTGRFESIAFLAPACFLDRELHIS